MAAGSAEGHRTLGARRNARCGVIQKMLGNEVDVPEQRGKASPKFPRSGSLSGFTGHRLAAGRRPSPRQPAKIVEVEKRSSTALGRDEYQIRLCPKRSDGSLGNPFYAFKKPLRNDRGGDRVIRKKRLIGEVHGECSSNVKFVVPCPTRKPHPPRSAGWRAVGVLAVGEAQAGRGPGSADP